MYLLFTTACQLVVTTRATSWQTTSWQGVVKASGKVRGHVVQVNAIITLQVNEWQWPAQKKLTASDTKRHLLGLREAELITLTSWSFWPVFCWNFFANRFRVDTAAMANAGGANVLANLKQRMQTLRDELDRCKDNYDDKCRELEVEREQRNEASISAYK